MSSATVSEATEASRKQGKTTERLIDGGVMGGVMGWTLGLVALGVLVYRPWASVPFDVVDYSELLPHLTGHQGSLDRLGSVISYYLDQGRMHLLTSVLIWGQWEIFGDWAQGWRLFRVGLFGVLIWLFLKGAIRFGVPRHMAGVGAVLFVLSWPATEGWLRLTGEPLAALFLMAGVHTAASYRESERPLRVSMVLMGLTVGMILAKETMVVSVPFLFLLASSWHGGQRVLRLRMDRRTLMLAWSLGSAVLILGTLIFIVSRTSGPEAYVKVYGTGLLSLFRFQYNALAMTWPLDHPLRLLSSFGIYSFLVLLLGLLLVIRTRDDLRLLLGIGFLVLFSLSGALIYLPWTRLEAFYAIPFLAVPAALLSLSAWGLRGEGGFRTLAAGGLMVSLLAVPAVNALRDTAVRAETRIVNWELARAVQNIAGSDSLVIAVEHPSDQAWQGRGPTLARYAAAMFGAKAPRPARDLTCAEVADRLRAPPAHGLILVSYHHLCGPLPNPDLTVTRTFRFPSLSPLGVENGRVSADVLVWVPPQEHSGGQDSNLRPGIRRGDGGSGSSRESGG